MKAVIIAGGRGTRLGLIEIPKPMVQVGEKPVLEYQINLLRHYGIIEIFILIGHLGHVIKDYFGDGKDFGVNLRYYSDDKPLGTSGCVKVLESEIGEDFLILYGDLMLDIKLDDFWEFHKNKGGAGTIIAHPNDHPYDSDLVVIDNDCRIIDLLPRGRKPKYYANLVNAAVYILTLAVFKYIPKGAPSDFVKDVFPIMLKHSEKLYVYRTEEYIKDIGTVDRLEEVNKDFLSGKVHRLSKQFKRPAIFMDRDGTLMKDIQLLHRVEDLELFPFSMYTIKKINDSNFLALVVTNQPVIAKNLCDISTVKGIHNKLETLLGRGGAYLNDIYFCPHHPDKGYQEENKKFKIECGCRKPKAGMIEKAVKEYNVDLELSWFIGDTTTDIQTGINAGLQTILVRTGRGGKDGKYQCVPDFIFDNLEVAIDFILRSRNEHEFYIEEIIDSIKEKRSHYPVVVSIAGLARSGKSSFVRLLTQTMQKNDVSNQVLSLDNWIVGVNERTDNMTVRERYKYDEIERDVSKLIKQKKILLKRYDPYSRNIVSEGYFSLDGSMCLIIDGVLSLDIDGLRNISDIKVYIEVDEDIRKERFISFYKWKDLPDKDIEKLYQKRLMDEVPFIRESKKYANIIVKV